MAETLLEVKNLQTHFYTRSGVAKAVEDVSFTLNESETLGLVGESGCGKSVTSLSIMRLISPPGKVVGGEILYKGDDILDMDQEDLYKLRGGQIAMIFQDPMTSLNPVLPIGFQIAEAVKAHLKMDDTAAMNRAAEMLDRVRIPEARRRLKDYPHQFSGGMRQRVMIAIALSCNPQILIADEPTTALDVTIQAQVLDLMKGLATEFRTATLLITHDLGVVAGTCDRVCVMYAGRVVETAPTAAIFKTPAHPYTQALLAAVPRPEQQRGERLAAIGGQPPNLVNHPPGCPFAPRCRKAQPRCRQELPLLENVGPNQRAACFYPY
jgi:oligopeptide transport system ATP-binding protein